MLNPKMISPFKTKIRAGIASIEIVVACTLLVAVIGTSAALMVRIRAIGVDAEYRSIALQEIANELESRLAQNADELSKLPVEWKPSVSLLHRWPDSVLRYKEIHDEIGIRGTVTFLRTTSPASEKIELSGWIAFKQGDAP